MNEGESVMGEVCEMTSGVVWNEMGVDDGGNWNKMGEDDGAECVKWTREVSEMS